ncbi:hypothetical protein EDC05_001504 [Coemansia umbellata]|uniref:SAGA-associated factor 11 n=1 Tax=Coemansia umbellata TaxID=1424467 RepID=A0ABQ8PRK5_9FUNG|nr:hypothetical protein EDC05_001504 [Coemansia umbellata]
MKPKAENTGSGGSSSMGATGSGEINDATAIFDELLRYYDSKISALRQTRESLEDSKPVLTPPSTPRGGGESDSVNAIQKHPRNRAMLSLELLADMVDDMAMGIVFETVFEAKQSVGIYSLCNTRCRCGVSSTSFSTGDAGADGPSSQEAISDMFECPNCQRSFPAARFASHMDKCMGLSSRRAATRRSAANSAGSTPSNALANYDSSSEQSADRKRK